MSDKSKLERYRFTPQELQIARTQLQETKDTIQRLRNFLNKTADVTGDSVALQRASALKTIHHLESQIEEWVRLYPSLEH